LTVTAFSMATAMLNLLSLTFTGVVIVSRMMSTVSPGAGLGPPPLSTLFWLLLALIPLSAMFSALSLTLAAMARSTKEGQYYLMPLMLVTMPLAMLPVLPTTEINLGNSLLPVTGVMLLLRALIEGDYLAVFKYAVPVTGVTVLCCSLAIRWAVHQFNNESVLFRESERFDLAAWLVHLVRDRGETPSAAEAMMCGILLLILQFFARLATTMPESWWAFVTSTLIVQLAMIATPVLLMTIMLTSSPKQTLLLRRPSNGALLASIALAVCLQPAATALRELVQALYPISAQALEQLAGLSALMADVPLWQILLLLAVVPAFCEELAFRGFVLSGLRHLGDKPTAILISSVLFGIVHGLLQQSLTACFLGMILGYVAVQTGSLLPCIVFHAAHNALQLLAAATFTVTWLQAHPPLQAVLTESRHIPGAVCYRAAPVIVSILSSGLLLYWLRGLPALASPEEKLQNALERQASAAVRS
jgi:sodium transport system permease protein